MPIFEYRCSECNTKFEVLHKSTTKQDDITCPKCHSVKNKKLFSSFSSTSNSDSYSSSGDCVSGQCRRPVGDCTSGLCGLN